jgi:Primase C terminal 2 (PriCT-2)/Bifunctional DNA primase/polymerase, N-terminal
VTETDNFMTRFGSTLTANGYRPIPLLPNDKVPGRYAQGIWTPYPDWARHCERPTRNFELDIWSRWPNCAVGLACGNVIGIDIDVIDKEHVLEPGADAEACALIEKLARDMLGDTPAKRIGMAPKRMLVYRSTEPFNGFKRHPLEVLGVGSQFVGYAIHKDTGRPYEWPDESLAELDISRLPAINEAQARAFMDRAWTMVPPALRQTRLSQSEGVSAWAGPGDPKGTLEAVKAALEHIPNDDLGWDDWIRIGLAIKGALGDKGRALWMEWSAKAPKNVDKTTAAQWRGMKPTHLGAGTLYWLAEQSGWTPDQSLTLNGSVAASGDEPHPAAGLIAEALRRATAEQHSAAVPASVMKLDGALKMLVDYSVKTAFSPQPFLSLGAAIAAVGALAGRRYASPTDLRTNVIIISLADSGSGKDQPRKCVKRAFFEAGVERYFGGERMASGQSIYGSLEIHPSRLFLLNEFGKLVGEMTNKNASHKAEILTNLTSLATSASEVVFGTEYAHQKGSEGRSRSDLHQPHVCVYGDTVAAVLWKAMQSGALGDGSVARFLVFQTDDDCPPYQDNQASMDVPPELVDALKAIAAGPPEHDYGGNLASAMTSSISMKPYVVPYGLGVAAMLRSQMDEQRQWKMENRNTWATAFIGRFAEHTIRCAMISAISRDPAAPVIERKDVLWARDLVNHCLVTAMRETDVHVADSTAESNIKRLLDVVRKAGKGGITKTDLLRRTRFLDTRQRTSIVADLIEGGELFAVTEKNGGDKPTTKYSASPGRAWQRRGDDEAEGD